MGHARHLLVFLQIFSSESINTSIELNPLLLKLLNLSLKRGVFVRLRTLETLFCIVKLAFKVINWLLLEWDLVLDLRRVALLVLFHVLELVLKVFKLYILLSSRFLYLTIHLVLDSLDAPSSPFFFLRDTCFKLCLFHFIEVSHLTKLLCRLFILFGVLFL